MRSIPTYRTSAILILVLAGTSRVAAGNDDLSALHTFSSIGKGSDALDGYREAELLRHEGKGCLTHMWFGGDWSGYEKTRVRVYVDGEQAPSIDMALGLGHGQGFADQTAPWGADRLGRTGYPSGIYNTYRIPFGKSVRVTAQRARTSPAASAFWWIVRGTENLPLTLGGVRLPESARLRLYRLENHTASPLEEFGLCDVQGPGALYQVTIAARGLRETGGWKSLSFLEACMRAYLDGATEPVFLSSGLEDYFLGTYYFNRGRYANNVAGLTHLNVKDRTFSAYRFHEADPVFFRTGLRLTCRCGETEDLSKQGKPIGDPPETEYTTYAWVYHWPTSASPSSTAGGRP
jgi:hypothetical protein